MKRAIEKISIILIAIAMTVCFIACDNQSSREHSIHFFVDNNLYETNTINSVMPNAPQKEGYKFAGWYQDISNLKSEFDFETFKWDKDLQVYAIWQLYTPTIISNNGVLNWNAVSSAQDYLLKINGIEYETSDTEFTMPEWEYGVVYNVQIIARTQELGYLNSTISDIYTFKRDASPLSSPTNIHYDECMLIWDAVDYANGYVCYINGRQYYV